MSVISVDYSIYYILSSYMVHCRPLFFQYLCVKIKLFEDNKLIQKLGGLKQRFLIHITCVQKGTGLLSMQSLLRMMEFLPLETSQSSCLGNELCTDLIVSNSNISTRKPPATAKASHGMFKFKASGEIKLHHVAQEKNQKYQ